MESFAAKFIDHGSGPGHDGRVGGSIVKVMLLLTAMAFAGSLWAEDKTLNFTYHGEDVAKVVEDYSKVSGQKFTLDPAAKGKITVYNKSPVSLTEAFNQLSTALAVNDLAISQQDDMMVIAPARSVERSLIDVGNDLPAMKPERLYTWMIKLKYVSADEVNKQVRILTSRNGEMVPFVANNELIITDWVSSLHRISKVIAQLDVPGNAKPAPVSTREPSTSTK